jgi:extracellular factor (EF) 3-hydroxypalmitic acid methyl ester biosynthesis protein
MCASIDDFFREHVPEFTRNLGDFARRVGPGAHPPSEEGTIELAALINSSLAACARLEAELAGATSLLRDVQRRYREAIWPWFGQSWFMRRALTKPRGYPGDYELLSAIYDRAARSPGIGGYLDRFFLKTALGRAVPARMLALRQFLLEELDQRQGDVSILNVACGSCREYAPYFRPTNHRVIRLTCIDNDPEALAFVDATVGHSIRETMSLSLVRYNALRMTSARATAKQFGRPDIIYSVGLCDYIPDVYLVPILRGWRELVHESGVVYVAFKDSRMYGTQEYQWLVDWYFYQRTEEECRLLFEKAGYNPEGLAERRDSTGIIMNFEARAKAPALVRVDAAEELPKAPTLDIVVEPSHLAQPFGA